VGDWRIAIGGNTASVWDVSRLAFAFEECYGRVVYDSGLLGTNQNQNGVNEIEPGLPRLFVIGVQITKVLDVEAGAVCRETNIFAGDYKQAVPSNKSMTVHISLMRRTNSAP
jgi:hypothetical protein